MIKLKYVLIFIKTGDEILLLNREKPSWMGCWNGVGGKIENNETPFEAAKRETLEETGIEIDVSKEYTRVGWKVLDSESSLGGMYCFLIECNKKITTPIKTREGILDYKNISWILDKENSGIAKNIPYFLPSMIEKNNKEYITVYKSKFDDFGEVIEYNFED